MCVSHVWRALLVPALDRVSRNSAPNVVASGFTDPLDIVPDPVVPACSTSSSKRGLVRVVRDGQLLPTPFIDLTRAVRSGGERGLLGMAFPPDAAASGRVFFNFTDLNGDTVVARFTRTRGDAAGRRSRVAVRSAMADRRALHPAAIREPQRRPSGVRS